MKALLFVVEDDLNSIELLKELFSDKEYELRCYTSPIEALEALNREGLPDLILTDLMMPEMDGIEFLCKVRTVSTRLPVGATRSEAMFSIPTGW